MKLRNEGVERRGDRDASSKIEEKDSEQNAEKL